MFSPSPLETMRGFRGAAGTLNSRADASGSSSRSVPKVKSAESAECGRSKPYWRLEGDRWMRLTPMPYPRQATYASVNGSPIQTASWRNLNSRSTTWFLLWWVTPGPRRGPSPADPNPFPRFHLFRRTKETR